MSPAQHVAPDEGLHGCWEKRGPRCTALDAVAACSRTDRATPARIGLKPSKKPQRCFVGRAVAALAADPHVARKNGGIYTTRALSEEYGFNDVDGVRPDYAVFDAAIEQAQKTFLAPMVDAGRFAQVDWKLTSKPEMSS